MGLGIFAIYYNLLLSLPFLPPSLPPFPAIYVLCLSGWLGHGILSFLFIYSPLPISAIYLLFTRSGRVVGWVGTSLSICYLSCHLS
jgi:hypothetical protein